MNAKYCVAGLTIAVALSAVRLVWAAELPVAHWPLAGDTHEVSGLSSKLHGHFDLRVAGPSGRAETAVEARDAEAWLEVAATAAPQVASGDFSTCAWVYFDEMTPEPVGGLVDQFDPSAERGWHLSMVSNAAATSSQANRRQLQFGIAASPHEAQWIDCGRPGKAVLVFALATYDGSLFAATCEPGADESGHVLRYAHPNAGEFKQAQPVAEDWVDCGSPDSANSVTALAVFEGQLYAATGRYRLRGSSLPDSPNQHPGGNVYRYLGEKRWEWCGKLGTSESINGLVVFRGRLYASSTYSPGVFRYEGQTRWTDIGTVNGRRIEALTVFDDSIFGGGYDAGEIYRYTPEIGWRVVGSLPETTQTYGFGIYRSQLYVGTWPGGSVYRFDNDRWTSCGRLGSEKEVMPIVVSHGGMFAGTLPLAEVYRYQGDTTWRRLAALDTTPDVVYRRVWCMAVHSGQLFAGTLPSGHVYRCQPSPLATVDLAAGWHHVAGIREQGRLRIAVDGKTVARSEQFDSAQFDLSTEAPLRIGAGPQAGFRGRLADVRIYNRALGDDELTLLMLARP